MINFLSSWVKNLALALIVVSILEMILPNSKIKKYVKMIMGIYILFSIVSPFIENSDKFDFNNTEIFTEYIEDVSSTDIEIDQTSMNNKLNKIYQEEIEKDIIERLKEKGYETEECEVIVHMFNDENNREDNGIEKIRIKISKKIDKENNSNSIESKIVTEIQKIQKIEINASKDNQDNKDKKYEGSDNAEDIKKNTNITKIDIEIIKDFLINEYGVSEKCLKIS